MDYHLISYAELLIAASLILINGAISLALRLGADADLVFFSLIAGRSNTPASLLAAIRCAPFLSMEHTLVEHDRKNDAGMSRFVPRANRTGVATASH